MKAKSCLWVLCFALILLYSSESIAAEEAASVVVNSMTASSYTVTPGQTVKFSATITASKNLEGYPIEFSWQPAGTHDSFNSGFSGTFRANRPLTQTAKWTIPADAAPGPYTLIVAVHNPEWDSPALVYGTLNFTVKSPPVQAVCGTSNGATLMSAPTTNLCNTGTASALSGNGPWKWSCAGEDNGKTAQCSASLGVPKSCTDASGNTHASGSIYTLQLSQTLGSTSATAAQCPYGGTQPITTTVTQSYSCTNGTQTAQAASVSTIADSGNPSCNAPVACGSTPSGSTVMNTLSTTSGSTSATVTQCPYGGTQPTTTTVTQIELCTNGTLSVQGSPVSTTTNSGSPTCNAAAVNGACGASNGTNVASAPTTGLCTTGTASSVSGSGPFDWTCTGTNGGSTASCSALLEINGSCGSANNVTASSAPTTNLCSTGTASPVAGSGPWTWSCAGTNGGTMASCAALIQQSLAFTINSITTSTPDVQPGQTITFSTSVTANQNAAGYLVTFWWFPVGASVNTGNAAFTDTFSANTTLSQSTSWTVPAGTPAGTYTLAISIYNNNWSTNYASEGITFIIGNPTINGLVGSAKGQDFTALTASSANLCTTGTVANFATTSTGWTWSCAGSNGGTTDASGMANLMVNGTCGSSSGGALVSAPTANLCSTGTASSVTGGGPWSWSCAGTNGGSTASCSAGMAGQGQCGPLIVTNVKPTTGSCISGTASAVSGSGPWTWNCVGPSTTATCVAVLPSTGPADLPGPSTLLYNQPFYTCQRNFYVATDGNDSNPGTQASPWLTIQNADSSSRQAGDCINVAPGLYVGSILIQHGGNAPTPIGYVAYRCETLDGCHIQATGSPDYGGGNHLWGFEKGGDFVVVDGFEVDGNSSAVYGGIADACLASDDSTYGSGNAVHHLWLLNNIVHDCTLSGITPAEKEWYYVIHNTVYNNSYTSPYQGSGISFNALECIESDNPSCYAGSTYVPWGMDLTYAPPFHNVVSGNNVYSNTLAPNNAAGCPGGRSDGNGIIMDTFYDLATGTILYPYQTLVEGNVAHANGARGIHVFSAANVTVANNTAYGNGTDTCINGFTLADLSEEGANDVWLNNVAQSVMTAAVPSCGQYCGDRNVPLAASDNGTPATFLHNITYGGIWYPINNGVALFGTSTYSCTDNLCNQNPQMVNPAADNFGLQSTSPAIAYSMGEYYLPTTPLDTGACSSSFAACPTTGAATNGACGVSNGARMSTAPTTGLCTLGTASAVTTSTGPWYWSCTGSNGGTTAQCSASP